MQENKMCQNLLLGVTGSVSTIDIHRYIQILKLSFAENIKVIATKNASLMLNSQILSLFTDDRIFTDLWDTSSSVNRIAHIQLPRWADCFVILPATADIIGKAANGIADDLLSTAILAYGKPIVFAPSMNSIMWYSKVVQRNKKRLEDDGHHIIPCNDGALELGTGEHDGVSPSIQSVLIHLKHVRMKELRNAYWETALKERPLTPMEKAKLDIEKKRQTIQAKKQELAQKTTE